MKLPLCSLVLAMLVAVGCHSQPDRQAVKERAWIGGDYGTLPARKLARGDTNRVYLRQVHPQTPAALAGLQAGDRLLTWNGQAVRTLRDFQSRLDSTSVGTEVRLQVLREGTPREHHCVVGREIYRRWHSLSFGFSASPQLDLWPDPDWSVLGLLSFQRPTSRTELNAPERLAARHAASPEKAGTNGEPGVHSPEGWSLWLGVLGTGVHHRILSQELPGSGLASRERVGSIPQPVLASEVQAR